MNDHERSYIRFLQAGTVAKRHLFRGEWLTATEIATLTGLKVRTVHRRIQYSLSIEGPPRFGPEPRKFMFRGRLATIPEMMAETGLSRSQVSKRTDGKRFYERREATDPYADPRWNARILFFAGVSDSVSGWSRRTGIPRYVIRERLDTLGWPLQRALTQPPMDRGGCRRRNRRTLDRIAAAIRRSRNRRLIERIAGGFRGEATATSSATA